MFSDILFLYFLDSEDIKELRRPGPQLTRAGASYQLKNYSNQLQLLETLKYLLEPWRPHLIISGELLLLQVTTL